MISIICYNILYLEYLFHTYDNGYIDMKIYFEFRFESSYHLCERNSPFKYKCRCYYFLPMCHVTNQSGARAKLRINGEMHRLEIFFIIFVPFFCCIILKPKQCTRKMAIKYMEQSQKKLMQFIFALFPTFFAIIGTQKILIERCYDRNVCFWCLIDD